MKKKQFKIIIILILLILLIYIIATTFSKFISTSNGNGILGGAKWHVKVGNVDISSKGNHDISTEIEMTPEANAAIVEGKIAPRSTFTGSFTIDPCDTDVNIEYTIKIGDFLYSGEASPNFELEKVTIDGEEVKLYEDNTYTGIIDINAEDYIYSKIEVVIYGGWNPQDYDNLTGIESGNLTAPINVTVEQSTGQWKRILELFKSGSLNIGDWVTYDAGTWTAKEIEIIKVGPNEALVSANNSTSLPTTNFQFGGFVEGTSRNDGALETGSGTYMYAKMYDDGDSANKTAISGWRVFDIDETEGTITLISAANPEDYFHSNSVSEYAYVAQYILTGTKHSRWSEKETAEVNYTIRDWSMYANSAYGATSARAVTLADLNKWYSKYLGTAGVTTVATFQKIYSEPYIKYQNLIENHSYYWLSDAYNLNYVYNVYPGDRDVNFYGTGGCGVRVLVSIPLKSRVSSEPIKERTVTEEGMAYGGETYGAETIQTYNVWELKYNK